MKNEIFEQIKKDAKYAIASLSRDLVYEAFGAAKMARKLGAIGIDEFYELNEMLIVKGINNYANCKLH